MGPYYWSYFGMMFCNVVSPQFFWSKKIRRSLWWTFFLSIVINIGMWFERFVIIATTLARDYIPSSWSYYSPTWVEIGIYLGTFGLFFTLFLLFTRVAPVVAIAEVKAILKTAGDQYTGPNAIHSGHGSHQDHGHELETVTSAASSVKAQTTGDGSVVEREIVVPPHTGSEDDLKKIEGIGPKIERALKDRGIRSFQALSGMSIEDLQYILDTSEGNFAGNDPVSWAQQATLAAEGRWSELKELQDRLDGGKY
jgi:predicted flap endonuclease-1-like 5' DNA nuclease